ncbi:MAG: DegT/DnrJ/EryC1/StrS family aminotransferase, partial [Bacteroidota bacterium]
QARVKKYSAGSALPSRCVALFFETLLLIFTSMISLIDLNKLHGPIQKELDEALHRVVKSGWYIGGEEVEKFEASFAAYCRVQHCVGCASGTDALELILRAYEIGEGDEVIVPALTWVSNAEVVKKVGATPVFADVDSSYTIHPGSIKSRLTSKTKALMAVHLYGQPCQMDEICELANTYKLILIEDCAQAHGATFNETKVGSLGHAAAFSFYPTKNLGAIGDAGCVTTNDKAVAEKIRLLANHGQKVRDVHVLSGATSRLDPIQAAVLGVKIKYLDQWNAKRQENANAYLQLLAGSEVVLPGIPKNTSHVFHQYVIRSENREVLRKKLIENNIQTAIHYPTPLNKMPFFGQEVSCPNAEAFCDCVVSIPIFPSLSRSDLQTISEQLLLNDLPSK